MVLFGKSQNHQDTGPAGRTGEGLYLEPYSLACFVVPLFPGQLKCKETAVGHFCCTELPTARCICLNRLYAFKPRAERSPSSLTLLLSRYLAIAMRKVTDEPPSEIPILTAGRTLTRVEPALSASREECELHFHNSPKLNR